MTVNVQNDNAELKKKLNARNTPREIEEALHAAVMKSQQERTHIKMKVQQEYHTSHMAIVEKKYREKLTTIAKEHEEKLQRKFEF